ncbi:MAG: hypothetical protein ACI9DC_003568 [Gammaproteobacteria bacterium]|jgi:hypothetical protein
MVSPSAAFATLPVSVAASEGNDTSKARQSKDAPVLVSGTSELVTIF